MKLTSKSYLLVMQDWERSNYPKLFKIVQQYTSYNI